jgi:hypothetical protein
LWAKVRIAQRVRSSISGTHGHTELSLLMPTLALVLSQYFCGLAGLAMASGSGHESKAGGPQEYLAWLRFQHQRIAERPTQDSAPSVGVAPEYKQQPASSASSTFVRQFSKTWNRRWRNLGLQRHLRGRGGHFTNHVFFQAQTSYAVFSTRIAVAYHRSAARWRKHARDMGQSHYDAEPRSTVPTGWAFDLIPDGGQLVPLRPQTYGGLQSVLASTQNT